MDVTYPQIPDGTDDGAVWSRRLADEFWSGPVTPLTFSLLAPAMVEQMASRALRVAGLDDLAERPVFRLHASHVYVNAGLLGDVVDLLPGLLHSDGLLALLPPAARSRVRPATPFEGLPNAARIAGKFLWREPAWIPWQRAAAFDTACARIRSAHAELPQASSIRSPWALVAEIARTQDALGDYLAVVSWGIVYAYVSFHLLTELVGRWAPGLEADAASLTIGLPGVVSLEAHHEVLALGRHLERVPAWRDATPDELPGVAHQVAADDGEIGTTFRRMLARHGHRLGGRDLQHATWREAPELLITLALRSARNSEAASVRESPAGRRLTAVATLETRLGGGVGGLARRAVFRATLAAAQRFCLVRENMRYHADFFLARLRELTLTLGDRLCANGTIAEPGDLFFLTDDELRQLALAAEGLGSPQHDPTLAPRITDRRARFVRDAANPPPLTLGTAADPPDDRPTPLAAPTELTGELGAPGRCEGRAQVVRTSEDFDQVRPGDVIIAAYADPTWTPMLDLAAGLVLEAGGMLSHGAIVARELGIPALVNVHEALTWIRSGDTVCVDTGRACVFVDRGCNVSPP